MSSYFIKIEDGPEVRRRILESSKASIHVLRGYQELLKIRGEKLTHMNHLKTQLRELTLLLNRAESLMPQLTEREMMELQPKPVAVKVVPKEAPVEGKWVKKGSKKVFVAMPKKTVVTEIEVPRPDLATIAEPVKPKPMTELEKLEQQLKAIEGKLGTL
jgi:tRNA A37 threonylcarbamoyladenosine synthetase subunit TsaC/SUA5/YrdC